MDDIRHYALDKPRELGSAMSISLWVCRVGFEPPFGHGMMRERGSERPRPSLSGSIGFGRRIFLAIRKQLRTRERRRARTAKRFRSEPPFAPTEGGSAINSCGAGSKASPEPSIARLFAHRLGPIGPGLMRESGPRRRAERPESSPCDFSVPLLRP
jgi:hypothetical protein